MAEGEQGYCRRQTVPVIRKVLKSISEEIADYELSKLIFLARDELPKGQTQNMDCLKLIGALEERQLIDTKSNDLAYLLDLLNQLPRVDLIKKLKSALPMIEYETTTITEEVFQEDDAVPTSRVSLSTVCTSVTLQSAQSGPQNADGGFLQDPDLLNSTYLEYHETIKELEKVTKERDEALKALKSSEDSKMELQKKVNSLEMELNKAKEDQENFICERNNALAAKSEFVFKESEARKELNDMKRTKNVLERNLTKSNDDLEKKEEENIDLKKKLEESKEESKQLKSKLETTTRRKVSVEEELQAIQENTDGGNGRIKCKRCGLVYLESNNPVDACRYHSGKYEITGSILKKQEWSCCRNTNKNAPGCGKKRHLSINYQVSPTHETAGRSTRLDTM